MQCMQSEFMKQTKVLYSNNVMQLYLESAGLLVYEDHIITSHIN